MSSILSMIRDKRVSIKEIGLFLDSLEESERLLQINLLTAKDQKRLYEKAEESEPLTLRYFVPEGVPPLTQVIHHGKNSLPIFRYFQKRFCWPLQGEERLFGYNETLLRPLIGPGYFVARSTENYPTWRHRGGVVVDYYQIPDSRIVRGWPDIVPNSLGMQRFIYGKTRDFMRRVSEHVSIGAVWKEEHFMDTYFVLCREEVLERRAIED